MSLKGRSAWRRSGKSTKRRLERMRSKLQVNPLRPDAEPIDIDDLVRAGEGVFGVS